MTPGFVLAGKPAFIVSGMMRQLSVIYKINAYFPALFSLQIFLPGTIVLSQFIFNSFRRIKEFRTRKRKDSNEMVFPAL